MNLNDAYICLDCDEIIYIEDLVYQKESISCPRCTCSVCQPLGKWIVPVHYRDKELYDNIKIKYIIKGNKNDIN